MKRGSGLLLLLLGILSIISGYLMSKASLVGKAGMSFFYREYNFLKVWWKGALMIYLALLALFIIHGLIQRKTRPGKTKAVHMIACLVALAGLGLTYSDFRHTLSHRLLGERFHLGVYLFWLGWAITSLFYFFQPVPPKKEEFSGEDYPGAVEKGNVIHTSKD